MLLTFNNVNNFFAQQLEYLHCQEAVKAYIVSIFGKYKYAHYDCSNQSLTLLYQEANVNSCFEQFQKVGDWLFWVEIMAPMHLRDASKEYYHSLARMSYYKCYKLINKKIDIYENLSDDFTNLIGQTQKLIQHI